MQMLHFEQKSISGVEYPLICFSKSIWNKSIEVVNAKMFLVLWALKDDTRMVQLRMHVTGDAEHTISGLGLRGVMYATALKTLKENFGQPSVIARAFIRKITERKKDSARWQTGPPWVFPWYDQLLGNASPNQLLRQRQHQWQSPKDCQIIWLKSRKCGHRHQRNERNPSTVTHLQFCKETCQSGIWSRFRRRSQDGYFKKYRLSQRR